MQNKLGTVEYLYHGTQLESLEGILRKGMFPGGKSKSDRKKLGIKKHRNHLLLGEGVYFTKCAGKASCFTSKWNNDRFYLLKCKVVLGNVLELKEFKERTKFNVTISPDKEYNSVYAVDKAKVFIKCSKKNARLYTRAKVDEQGRVYTELQNNEFCVYDHRQIFIEYILEYKCHKL